MLISSFCSLPSIWAMKIIILCTVLKNGNGSLSLWGYDITSGSSGELLASLNDDQVNQVFCFQGKRHAENEYRAYDSSIISSYFATLAQILDGRNMEDDKLPQFKLLLFRKGRWRWEFIRSKDGCKELLEKKIMDTHDDRTGISQIVPGGSQHKQDLQCVMHLPCLYLAGMAVNDSWQIQPDILD